MKHSEALHQISHEVDFCVVGGGLSGLAAAVSSARGGARTLLMHDRPVLGGNSSSEIRMWVCGAHGANNLETGLIEEIRLENLYRNRDFNWSIWDSILYEKAAFQENLTLLLNCSCNDLKMEGDRIVSVTGWQTTTQQFHTVKAALFADCSGDSILAPLSGAEVRIGRESRAEFGEDIQPETADRRTMGMSCLIQARETTSPKPFIAPAWANVYESENAFPHRGHDLRHGYTNFWWMELGGEDDSIADTETLRDELLKVAFGVWDHIKNRGEHGAENWQLEWVGFLPGKRESRRYVGPHMMTQNDVRNPDGFPDVVAYGGWSMDDHHPEGLHYPGMPTIFHPAPSPYHIPFRSLYSRNISNLFCAGRNISATHAALSSTRVMATCALLGEAVGTAAALAVKENLLPAGISAGQVEVLQELLQEKDAYLPGKVRKLPPVMRKAVIRASEGDPSALTNGVDRPVGTEENSWSGQPGGWVEIDLGSVRRLRSSRIVFDSDLNRKSHNMPANLPLAGGFVSGPPQSLVREFVIEARGRSGGWEEIYRDDNNYQRLRRIDLGVETSALRLRLLSTWGGGHVRLFAFEVREE